MKIDAHCKFCEATKKGMMENIPLQSGVTPCKRGIYEDKYCFAVLAPEQYSIGHTLLILEKHKSDITASISEKELSAFINAIHKVSKHLKDNVRNELNQIPERIYVCILCDGIEHLHAHLIPRYPFNDGDINIYKQLYLERDGIEEIKRKIQDNDLGGFWYIGEREKNYKESIFGQKSDQEKVEFLERIADQLRID